MSVGRVHTSCVSQCADVDLDCPTPFRNRREQKTQSTEITFLGYCLWEVGQFSINVVVQFNLAKEATYVIIINNHKTLRSIGTTRVSILTSTVIQ